MALEIGQLVEDKYRIVRLIGEGGMGSVYEGENVRISRRVAIKVLHAAFTGNPEVMQRFEREAQAAGRIGNDHILEVLDLGTLPDGDHFIIMEFLDGEPLSSRIQARGRLFPEQVAPIARQVLTGLGAAHAAGIIHRDLKPENIFILREKAGQADFVKIIDFGISKFQPLSGDGMKMTRTGAVMGTPYYMSPEQASGSTDADARSDLYSVGVMLFEAVTGRVPFEGTTFNQLMFKIVLSEVPAPELLAPDLDPAFGSIIKKSMARDVAHRFQSAEAFAAALDAWVERRQAVSVPPLASASEAGLLPGTLAGPAPSALGRTPGPSAKTAGSWASSQPTGQGRRSRTGALVALGALAVLGVAGAAAWSMRRVPAAAPSAWASAPDPSAEQAPAAIAPSGLGSAENAEAAPRTDADVAPHLADGSEPVVLPVPSDGAEPDAASDAAAANPAHPAPAVAAKGPRRPVAPHRAPVRPMKSSAKPAKAAGRVDFGY